MSTPLKNLLEYVEGEVWRSDETGVVMIEMARRLRKLDESHRELLPEQRLRTCRCCPRWPCRDRRILDGGEK